MMEFCKHGAPLGICTLCIKEHFKKEWQKLSNDEIQSITWKIWGADALEPELDYARAIEQALKNKNS